MIQQRIAKAAERWVLEHLQPMSEVDSVAVTRCAGELTGRWFVTVDATVAGGKPVRFSGWGDRQLQVQLSRVDIEVDPFAGVNQT